MLHKWRCVLFYEWLRFSVAMPVSMNNPFLDMSSGMSLYVLFLYLHSPYDNCTFDPFFLYNTLHLLINFLLYIRHCFTSRFIPYIRASHHLYKEDYYALPSAFIISQFSWLESLGANDKGNLLWFLIFQLTKQSFVFLVLVSYYLLCFLRV